MFIWYKKGNVSGKSAVSRTIRHFIIGLIIVAVVGGIICFFTNSKEIISTKDLKDISVEEGFEYSTSGDNEATITAEGITVSIIDCSSAAEAEVLFDQYCAEYPKEDADNTEDIDFGDSYSKYSASGSKGVLITARINERVAVIMTDDVSNKDAVKKLFNKIVK